MRLLLLGGTRFLGRHIAQQALAAGHELTLLHRGRSGPGLFPDAEHRIADRDDEGALAAALDGGQWDAAIDTSAYVPRQVRMAAALLADRVAQYQLVSTISVYAGFETPGTDESAPVRTLANPATEIVNGATYGGLKALCEAAAYDGFGDRCLVSRPGLLVGPHDPTGRFTWWVQRLQRGGAMLAPGHPDAQVQCIDARDAAAWHLHQAEQGSSGVFNLTGPEEPTTMGELLRAAGEALHSDVRSVWLDEAFLLEQRVAPWTELPLWLPRSDAGLHEVSIERALATGLVCRPIAQTVTDTAAWADAAGAQAALAEGPPRPAVGLSPEREAALLALWAERGNR